MRHKYGKGTPCTPREKAFIGLEFQLRSSIVLPLAGLSPAGLHALIFAVRCLVESVPPCDLQMYTHESRCPSLQLDPAFLKLYEIQSLISHVPVCVRVLVDRRYACVIAKAGACHAKAVIL